MKFSLDGLSFSYGRSRRGFIDKITLSLTPGPVLLLGRNGAGKSTLLQLAAGLLQPSSGKVNNSGRVVYLPQTFVGVAGFTCLEYVSYLAWLNGRPRAAARRDASTWLKKVGLNGCERQVCTRLSGGQQSRLALAMVLNSGADLILLDEPGAALDPLSKDALRDLYQIVVDAGVALVVSSHDPTDILGPFARIVIIEQGAVRYDGSPHAFRYEQHSDSLVADFSRSMFPQQGEL